MFNLKENIGDTRNLIEANTKKTEELKYALKKIILAGRSTEGAIQENEGMKNWSQINFINGDN